MTKSDEPSSSKRGQDPYFENSDELGGGEGSDLTGGAVDIMAALALKTGSSLTSNTTTGERPSPSHPFTSC